MKKVICWLMATVAAAALADTAPTYAKLSWSVPGASVAAVNASYVNLYAEAGGVRVGCDGRAAFGKADTGLSTSTVVLGEGGWDWSSADLASATFAVEFLNAELGVIATSDPVPYADLAAADAFELNLPGSGVPVNGDAPYSFAGLAVDSDGIWEELKSVFGANAKVVPVADADGTIVSHTVTLANNMQGAVGLKGNLGVVTVDLNGFDILGQDAANGSAAKGGDAIEVAGMLDPDTGKPTELVFVNTGAAGAESVLAGGRGADAETGLAGGHAVSVAEGISGVTVSVGANVAAKGGASGNSTTGAATAGASALENATLASGTAADGESGSAFEAWAYAKCTYSDPAHLPAGTTQVGDTLWFWKRVEDSIVPTATFDFGALAGETVADGKIYFTGGVLEVDQFVVPASVKNLTFVGADTTALLQHPCKSVFKVTSADDSACAWTNVAFVGSGADWELGDGGAIDARGGAVRIADCRFEGCTAGRLGGAVCAAGLMADSEIVRTTFATNGVAGINLEGGALYASAGQAGVTLRVAESLFVGNEAVNGGAVTTVARASDDDLPVALAITDTLFADNAATWQGGAVFAEGDVSVDAAATKDEPGLSAFENNIAGVSGGAISVGGTAGEALPVALTFGRGVVFADNVASNAHEYVTGGAVDVLIPGTRVTATGVAFLNNAAYGSGNGSYFSVEGGAFAAGSGTNVFDTCVFDGNDAVPLEVADFYYGGAISANTCETQLKNCTFRRSGIEAVSIYCGSAGVTNCVLVGNSVDAADALADIDLLVEDASVSAAYSAWGTLSGTLAEESAFNLANRTAAGVYDGESLHLCTNAFNAVAALGLVQPGVYDFDGVEYGSLPKGYSMGAFEAPAVPAEILVAGLKTYDGHSNSNGCAWTFTATETDPDFLALGDVSTLVTVTEWEHPSKDAGAYDVESGLVAAVEGNGDETKRWIEQGLVTFAYAAEIDRRDIALGGLSLTLAPEEYPYTGAEVLADLVVVDTLPDEDEPLAADVDYALAYADNVNPTASAKVTATTLRNYTGATNLLYAITAYFVDYAFDGEVRKDLTKTYGETSKVAVAVSPADMPAAPAGYALDWQWSYTNDVVRRFDDGLLHLEVRYCTDANGDTIPDKYQRKVLAKVVNGEWSKNADGATIRNGADQVLWATLTGTDGKWSATGTAQLSAGELAATRPDIGFSAGGWLGFVNGSLAVVDPLSFDVSASSVPFLIYAYSHGGEQAGSGSGRTGRTGGKGGTSTAAAARPLLEQYSGVLTLKQATLTGTQMKITTSLVIRDEVAASTLANVPVNDTTLKLYVAEHLGDDWTETPATTDGEGNITVDLTGRSGFYRVGL